MGERFPILVPPDTDDVPPCMAPANLRKAGQRMDYPLLAWDTTEGGQREYELQFAPYNSSVWTTIQPQENPVRVVAVFNTDTYYKARIRSRCYHGCVVHNIWSWSPWSEEILFYTGPTEPDTTTAITPVEGCPDGLFTLTPNPATGTVTVTVGSLTHSSALAGTSPNLGEELVLTLRDAAGHEVLRKEFSIVNCQFSIPLDLSGLAAGTYFVTLSTPTATGTQRLVVR
ncbi:MAG: T9SS type A sorting domain-containing protein [Bacteroidales bacterium]|nr:T9SS type A sorting domain-containing protein [Bacteroidales bacterium]